MTVVWGKAEQFVKTLEQEFSASGTEVVDYELDKYSWINKIYTGTKYRRAHIEVVDKRETDKIFIVHSTVFPHLNDPSPIWGFDVVCGPSKITGAFLDFSSGGDPFHPMLTWFRGFTESLTWKKPRDLPGWAQQIFSPGIVAAGNIQTLEELELLNKTLLKSLRYYLDNVGRTRQDFYNYKDSQNRYCYWQKQNPRVVNSMVAMGIPEAEIREFVDKVLFPEI